MELFDVITDLRGVGTKKAAALKKLNIHTLEDLLFFFPPQDYLETHSALPEAA